MEKPHRFLLDRVSSYAEEGAAFLRRRRLRGQPFARVGLPGGEVRGFDAETDEGRRLFLAASSVLGLTPRD
jgi:hypothetical protein